MRLIVYSAAWCGPCKIYKHNGIKTWTKAYGASRPVEIVDVETPEGEARAKGKRILALPTTTIESDDGEILARITGVLDRKAMDQLWTRAERVTEKEKHGK